MQRVDPIEESFNDFLVCHEDDPARQSSLEKEFGALINECQGESQDNTVKQYINVVSTVNNADHAKLLLGLLESAVASNIVTAR